MKKLVATVLLCSFCAPIFAYSNAESENTSSRWLKLSGDLPFAVFGAFIGKAEFNISDRMSLLANVGYVDPRISVNPGINSHKFGNDGFQIVKMGVGGRWYPWKGGCMEGVFFENIIDTDVWWTYSGNAISLGTAGNVGPIVWTILDSLHIGYSWVTDIGFFADMAMGINVEATLLGIPTDTFKFSFYPTATTTSMNRIEARVAVGWAF